jgi:hypothetical protein
MKPVLTADERREAHVQRAPVSLQGGLRRALAGEGSPRQIIKAKCLDCCNWERVEVANCTVVTCPLWRLRPYQKGAAEDE